MYFDRDFEGANRENEQRKNLAICAGLSQGVFSLRENRPQFSEYLLNGQPYQWASEINW